MKQCSKCKAWKIADLFPKDSRKKDGLDSRCRYCRKESENKLSRQRRDARRYEKDKLKIKAREAARLYFVDFKTYKCAVLNCDSLCEELHHVNYAEACAVVPFCSKHHKENHDVCK